jgi:hypothetical protein
MKRRIIASAKTLGNRAGGADDDVEAEHSDGAQQCVADVSVHFRLLNLD